jgi:hypothetical protein
MGVESSSDTTPPLASPLFSGGPDVTAHHRPGYSHALNPRVSGLREVMMIR